MFELLLIPVYMLRALFVILKILEVSMYVILHECVPEVYVYMYCADKKCGFLHFVGVCAYN